MLFIAPLVERVGVAHEIQTGIDQPCLPRNFIAAAIEAFFEVGSVTFDVVELLLDLGSGDVAVGGEFDEIGFLDIQAMQLGRELLFQEPGRRVPVGESLGDVLANGCDELGGEPEGGVVVFNRALDAGSLHEGGVAGGLLPAPAEEVQVLRSARVTGALQDEAALLVATLPAVSAEQGALEVVVVDASPLACHAARLDDRLDAVEQTGIDEGLVASLKLLSLVGDVAEVVAVTQHEVEVVDRHLSGGVFGGWPAPQPPVVKLIGQIREGVIAGRVQLERQSDEVCPLGVNGDRPDLAELGAIDDIEVADGGASERAAVLGLLAHFVGDVGARLS